MKKILIMIVCLVMHYVCCAQSSVPTSSSVGDYIVLANGDTIYGKVENRDWKINPVEISFQSSGKSSHDRYNASQLKAFYLANENQFFQSITVLLDQSPAATTEVTADNANLKKEKTVFATVLYKGTASLFQVFDFKNHFLVQKGNDKIQELSVQRKVSGSGVQTLDLFKGQLGAMFNDCPSLSAKVNRASYTRNSLLSLFKDYGLCKGDKSVYSETKQAAKKDFGVIAGASLTTHSFSGEDAGQLGRSSYDPLISPSIGIFFNHTFPKNFGMYSWYNELHFKSFYAKSELTERQLNYDITYRNHSKFAMLRYLTGIKIKFTHSQRQPFISSGLSASVALKKEFYTDVDRIVVSSGEPGPSTQEKYDVRGFEFGFWLGAGLPLNQKLGLEVRAEKQQGYSTAVGFQAKVAHYSALLSYKLSK